MPSLLKTNRIQRESQLQTLQTLLDGILLQALHNVLHVASVDVVSFQQAIVAGALHSKL